MGWLVGLSGLVWAADLADLIDPAALAGLSGEESRLVGRAWQAVEAAPSVCGIVEILDVGGDPQATVRRVREADGKRGTVSATARGEDPPEVVQIEEDLDASGQPVRLSSQSAGATRIETISRKGGREARGISSDASWGESSTREVWRRDAERRPLSADVDYREGPIHNRIRTAWIWGPDGLLQEIRRTRRDPGGSGTCRDRWTWEGRSAAMIRECDGETLGKGSLTVDGSGRPLERVVVEGMTPESEVTSRWVSTWTPDGRPATMERFVPFVGHATRTWTYDAAGRLIRDEEIGEGFRFLVLRSPVCPEPPLEPVLDPAYW